ncbi:transcription antitermination factor NusB [Aerococcaceae bacterium NML210727]|nr:transcription antitermination factor NusB [Aerococcaceae bacterium NML210727]MCW6654341.1 transcription antitermination factor NusB [Aerococcaceae bacterium NML201296]MCW6661115.1 transcription antitermination factor NusB [Aerococcaceae bacterium NML201209]MCW6662883.1 transcription antitermination factor NusB [Aerococcaceae bacterium NML190073]MCW6664174.1 transcription antitermination factor NusB [Aerococcaceae bacterium NML191219]MCW6666317.1 transcription antitermination factor NusB [Ae
MSNKQKLTRRQVREKAVQTLYQLLDPQADTTLESALAFSLEAGNDPEAGFEHIQDEYLQELVAGVQTQLETIDQQITTLLTEGWTLQRLAKIDLAILRLGFYEVLYVDNEKVPPQVAVDEAIELSKTFSDGKSTKFIAGVLSKFIADKV